MESHEALFFQLGGTEEAGGVTKPALWPTAIRILLVTAEIGLKLAPKSSNEGPPHGVHEASFASCALAENPRSLPARNHPLDPTKLNAPSSWEPPAGMYIGCVESLVH